MKKISLFLLFAVLVYLVPVNAQVVSGDGGIRRTSSNPNGNACTTSSPPLVYQGQVYNCVDNLYTSAATSTDSTKIPLAGSSSVSGDITSTAGFFGRKIGGVGYAAEYNGSTDADKISNAAAANNAVFLTTRLGSTTSMSTNLTPNVLHFDFRRGAAWDYTNGYSTSFSGGYSIAQKLTADYTSGGNPSLVNLFLNPQQGGVNANLNKTNYSGSFMQILKQTPGQTNGYSVILNANSPGDAQGHVSAIRYAGHINAPGDEGAVALRGQIDIGGIYLATVGSIDSSTLTMSSQSGTYSRGQGRYLINTNASKIYSTGSVTSFSGTPPVVTFSGTTLTSLGSGTVSNLCFAMDSDASTYGYKHVVPIKSIDSNTQVTLNYQLIGLDYSWPSGLATSGNYKIYKCSTISKVNDSTIEVADPSVFAATDTVESPLLYGPNLVGAKIVYSLAFPGGIGSGGLSLDNQNDLVPVDVAIAVSGKHKTAAKFTSQLTDAGIIFYEAVGTGGIGPLISHAGSAISTYTDIYQSLNNANNATSHLRYNKSTDRYSFGTASGEVYFTNTGDIIADGLTASKLVFTNGSKQLVSAPVSGTDIGAQATPVKDVYLYGSGTFGSHSFKFTGTPSAHRTLTLPDRTATVATTSGTLTSGNCAQFDASGNIVDSGGVCGGGASLPVTDTTGVVKGSSDATKILRFEVDGFTTATTRVATFPDANITVARTDAAQTFTGNQTFTGAILGQGQLDAAGGAFTVNGTTGSIITNAGLRMGDSSSFYWNNRSIVTSPSDGVIRFTDFNTTEFSRLQLGGGTSSYPALKRNSTALEVKLADDSAYAPLASSTLTLNSAGTATATAGAATANVQVGTITSESLTTAAGAAYTLTLTNSLITTSSRIFISFTDGTNTQGTLELGKVTAGSGSATIVIRNTHASEALNGTIKISYMVF